MTGRRARRALDRILAANSLDDVLGCAPDARSDVYEALLALEAPSAWWQQVAASVARRRAVTPAYVVDRAMAWLATLAELRRHDLYAFFGVEPRATADEIRDRWRDLAKRYHPDHGGTDPVLFRRFQEAYAILSDPVQRMRYEDGWRRRNGPAVALIAEATRPARSGRRVAAQRRAASGLRRVRTWARRMRPAAGPALRTVGVAAAIVLLVRFGRLPEWPTQAEDPAPAIAAKTPAPVVPAPLPPARPAPPPPQVAPAPVVVLAPKAPPTAPPPAVAPATFGETVVAPVLAAQGEPEVIDGMSLPEPVVIADAKHPLPVVSVARSARTTTPAALHTAAASASTTRSARPAAAPDTATPAGRRRAVVTAEVVPTTPAPPVMHLAAAVTAPPVPNAAAEDRRPLASATTLPPATARTPAVSPAARAAKAPTPKPVKVADTHPKPAKPEKTTKVAATKKPVPRVGGKAAPGRPVAVASAAPTGMMMALTSPEPVDLRSAQLFVREFARRYSAHEAAGLLEMFASGGSADGRHGTAIADGFGATFRRLGDVRLEPAHVELQPMAGGAVVRADYTLFVPGRDPVRGRAQWVLVRAGGAVRASQMLSSTVAK